jgi:uncharacterized protein (TIGR03086 family)
MSTATPPVPVVLLDRAITWAHGCLEPVRSAPLDLRTPCSEWRLGQLLVHMEDALVALAEAAELGHIEVDDTGTGCTGASSLLVDRLVQRACRTREAWRLRVTSAPITVDRLLLGRDTIALVGALEIAVHGWDVARSTGHDRELPEDLAARLLEVARAVVTPTERGDRFGPALPVAASAPPSRRLLAHLGRDPGRDWA